MLWPWVLPRSAAVGRLGPADALAGALAEPSPLAAALGAALIEFLLVRRPRHADPIALAILTIGVDIVLSTDLSRRINQDLLFFGDPWQLKTAPRWKKRKPENRRSSS